VVEFGDVTNDLSGGFADADSQIVLEWSVITLDTIDNNTLYWVSAGAEYSDGDFVWVGQAGFQSLLDDYTAVSTRASPRRASSRQLSSPPFAHFIRF